MSNSDSQPDVPSTSERDEIEHGHVTKKSKIDHQTNALPDKNSVVESDCGTTEASEASQKPDPKKTVEAFLKGLQHEDLKVVLTADALLNASYQTIEDLSKNPKLVEMHQKKLKFDLKEYLETGKKRVATSDIGLRIAVQDYKFDEPLTHDADVEALKKRLEEVRQWHSKKEDRDRCMAPLLPVIQSSGTGKSRLLFELRKALLDDGKFCRSILLTNQDETLVQNNLDQKSPDKKVYDKVCNVNNYADKETFRNFVLRQCKECIKDKKPSQIADVTLFFDEAQNLTEHDGKLFKALRWVIREKQVLSSDARYAITVVLAGTTSSLANFFPENSTSTGNSRFLDVQQYYESGKVPYEPFYTLRTQGCLSNQRTQAEESEYQKMIRFSRPLFQVLNANGKWGNNVESDIARKIVLGNLDWTKNVRSCLSVLATRVQMGATSTSVVSDLVSKGYAHLTFFRNKDSSDRAGMPSLASFAFLPDPVCARLAMCLMDENFKIGAIEGASKKFIANTMGTIFSSGLCFPAKGDLGEIAVALYLLFCGDILRAQKGRTYHSLSVDLSSWMRRVWNKGNDPQRTTKYNQWEGLKINCIQFFRYAFRSSLEELGDSTFLKSLYSKGCAIYCPTNTEAIDLVIPCHVGNDTYIPIFVSVKNYAQLYPAAAVKFLKASYDALKGWKINNGLLLLGIAGQDRPKDNVRLAKYESEWVQDDILVAAENMKDLREKLCVGFFCVHDDTFEINKMLQGSSFVKAQQQAEVYSMHSELIHVAKSNQNTHTPTCRYTYRYNNRFNKDATEFYTETLGMVNKKVIELETVKENT